jgi:branched-chain amino acid transport system permease protein
MLRIEGLSRHFGGVKALNGATCSFEKGRITGLVGPNGAGKTTIFNLVTGLIAPTAGRVEYEGRDITGLRPFEVARRGVGRTFQHTRIIRDLTVLENVVMGLPSVQPSLLAMMTMSRARRVANEQEAMGWLAALKLESRAAAPGADLSYAEQKLLMLCCLLASGARTLLLDEPTAGLDPASRRGIVEAIAGLAGPERTIVLVEHNLDVVRGLCDRVVFLAEGRVIAEGTAREIEARPDLAALYFGHSGGGNAQG